MKKRNLKSLKLHKDLVSNLTNKNVQGGNFVSKLDCQTLQNSPCTSFIDACPTAWCPFTQIPRDCIYTW